MAFAPIVIRAYDFRGYGDVGAAIRIGQHLKDEGYSVLLSANQSSVIPKARFLGSSLPMVDGPAEGLQVDVIGTILTADSDYLRSPPHMFISEMAVGWNPKSLKVPVAIMPKLIGDSSQPMFYRPQEENLLPRYRQVDVNELLLWQMGKEHDVAGLEKLLSDSERVGFGYFPFTEYSEASDFFKHPYVKALEMAACKSRLTLCLFSNPDMERRLTNRAIGFYGVVSSSGKFTKGKPGTPSLVFIGGVPQLIAGALFMKANMPNLVTGDLSLSDSLYFLLAHEGPGFFYDSAIHKYGNELDLVQLFSSDEAVRTAFIGGSGITTHHYRQYLTTCQTNEEVLNAAAAAFTDDAYPRRLSAALKSEIARRYKLADVEVALAGGSPVFIQDAVEKAVRELLEDPLKLQEVESMRSEFYSSRGLPFTHTSAHQPA
ncbi:hypothetical protein HYY74_06250 [Candidatus Woesearchaeota archaeon]|nr:hypothetical protein [Candidatus Woesearchaeota archaeon]